MLCNIYYYYSNIHNLLFVLVKVRKINTQNPTTFKKRYIYGYVKPKLRFGNLGLKIDKNYTLEKLYIILIKKKLKFFLKKKTKIKTSTWFFLIENNPVFKKGKNARMGKGKGIFQRCVYRVKKNQILLEFFNLNKLFLKKISQLLKSNANINNSLYYNYNYNIILNQKNLTYYNLYNRF